jgi:predicted membrane-bound spermidine synthase
MKKITELFLYGTVFLTGAAVLVIEIAAVRMLSPYYGSSLYVFSSVLTIILAALSLGYYVGGRLADRVPKSEPLFALISISGLLTLLAQFLAAEVLPLAEGVFSTMTGPLIFGFFFFFAPGFLLGIVSPYLVKLLSLDRSHAEIGSIAGTVFFSGTLGSITGSLLSGFLLIPLFGIRHSMVGTGVVLIVLGVVGMFLYGFLHAKVSPFVIVARFRAFILFTIVGAVMLLALIYRGVTPFPHTVLYRSDGVYGHIVVYEAVHQGHPMRGLKRDTNNESATYLDSYDLVFEYTQFATWYKRLMPDAQEFLMIGGGAYSVPRTLLARDPDLNVTVVEIEPDLFPLAVEYFDVPKTERLANHVMDGRVFLNENTKQFDVIFLDAFGTNLTIPAHLATKEYFERVKSSMSDEGVFIINYIGYIDGEAPTLTGSLTKTLASVFPNMEMYGMYAEKRDRMQNIVYILRNGTDPIDISGEEITLYTGGKKSVDGMKLSMDQYLVDEEVIFTDDRAPIEFLMSKQY